MLAENQNSGVSHGMFNLPAVFLVGGKTRWKAKGNPGGILTLSDSICTGAEC